MSKKIKGVGFKQQGLLHDYLLLQKETESARSKLEAIKLKKLSLQAEVRFLRRRRKFLSMNQRVRINSSDGFDLNQETQTTIKTRVPTFDLNQISKEEEEEELEQGLKPIDSIRSVMDEKLNELKLSVCRNVIGDSSAGRATKRKISWQDPVALRV